jgi:hypothetical protein
MSHFKAISKLQAPAKAQCPSFESCIDYLWNTCDVKGFVNCLEAKFTCGKEQPGGEAITG